MQKSKLGERMKLYESLVSYKLMPLLPAIVRVDGRAFHSFCKGLRRPYDQRLSDVMIQVTKNLVEETNALIGYTQSDEISLLLYTDKLDTQLYFDGRVQKIVSQTAALATREFTKNLLNNEIPGKMGTDVLLDSRVFNVSTKNEAVAYFLWRERDATKNSITMATSAYYSHKDLQGKRSADKHELLHSVGVNWNDYAPHFKRGTFVRRIKRSEPFTAEELNRLPEKHEARTNSSLTITRSVVELVDMPPFDSVTNKVGVLFNEEVPITA